MPVRHVALLRGINVCKAKRVAMADLRKLVESLGYSDVRTLLNSGNIVFTSPRPDPKAAARIEQTIAKELGVSSRVTVLTAADLVEVVAGNTLLNVADNPSRLLVAVLNNPADRSKLTPLLKQDWSPEVLAVGARVAYIWCPDGVIDSLLLKAVERAVASAVTSRNWATILKLHAMTEEAR